MVVVKNLMEKVAVFKNIKSARDALFCIADLLYGVIANILLERTELLVPAILRASAKIASTSKETFAIIFMSQYVGMMMMNFVQKKLARVALK